MFSTHAMVFAASPRKSNKAVALVVLLAVLLGPTLASAAPTPTAAGEPVRPVAAAVSPSATGKSASTSHEQSQEQKYAQREVQAKGLENFKGGDTIIIG